MDAIKERFWSKVDKTAGCWTWNRYVAPKGYAQFHANAKAYYAHRVSYEWAHGPIPIGMEIDHTCHVRSCVNPDHLRAVTRKQNNENLAGAHVDSKSGVRGVSWNVKNQKWQAKVRHNRRDYYVGLYIDLDEAEAAVIAKRLALFTHNSLDRKAS